MEQEFFNTADAVDSPVEEKAVVTIIANGREFETENVTGQALRQDIERFAKEAGYPGKVIAKTEDGTTVKPSNINNDYSGQTLTIEAYNNAA